MSACGRDMILNSEQRFFLMEKDYVTFVPKQVGELSALNLTMSQHSRAEELPTALCFCSPQYWLLPLLVPRSLTYEKLEMLWFGECKIKMLRNGDLLYLTT